MAVAIEWVKNEGGAGPRIRDYPEGTSETFKKGALVIYDRSEDGVVEVAVSSGVPSDANFLGIALKAATGIAGNRIPVLIPRSGDTFKASVASDQTTGVAPIGDHRGQLFGIIKLSADSKFVLDSATTSHVKIIDINPEDVTKRGLELNGALASGFTAGEDSLLFQFQEAVLDNAGGQA
ncbi:MAG: hypothetical protein ACRD2L_04125 [Terriglobia bacterium]